MHSLATETIISRECWDFIEGDSGLGVEGFGGLC